MSNDIAAKSGQDVWRYATYLIYQIQVNSGMQNIETRFFYFGIQQFKDEWPLVVTQNQILNQPKGGGCDVKLVPLIWKVPLFIAQEKVKKVQLLIMNNNCGGRCKVKFSTIFNWLPLWSLQSKTSIHRPIPAPPLT